MLCQLDRRMFGGDSLGGGSVREVVGALLLRHTCQLVSNAHAITGIVRTNARLSASRTSTLPSGEVSSQEAFSGHDSDGVSCPVDESQQVRLATAIYPTASLMNHACDPSIISRSVLI